MYVNLPSLYKAETSIPKKTINEIEIMATMLKVANVHLKSALIFGSELKIDGAVINITTTQHKYIMGLKK